MYAWMCKKCYMEWKLTKAKISLLLLLGQDMEHSHGKELKILFAFTMRGKLNWKLKRRKSGFLSFAQTFQESNTRLFWKIYRTSSQCFWQVAARNGKKVETLCKIVCDRWINDDIINCIFKMLNSNSKEHLFDVATEALLYSTKTQQNLRAEIK